MNGGLVDQPSAAIPQAAGSSLLAGRLTDVGFGLLFVLATGAFMIWGLDYTNSTEVTIFVLATVIGLFMAFNIGGNDVANSFGTSVGAGTVTIKQALGIAAIFEVSGAIIAGGEVTKTIRKGIVDLGSLEIEPMQFVFIMMSALLAAALWLLFATRRGWPVSTTHSIVGGIVGAAIALGALIGGADTALALVQWDQIGLIATSWVVSPLLGGLASFALFGLIKTFILLYNDRMQAQIDALQAEQRGLEETRTVALDGLSDAEKVSAMEAMERDARAIEGGGASEAALETDVYKKIFRLKVERGAINADKALRNLVPIVAAGGAAIISAMLLFKGLKNLDLGLSTLDNFLIMGMVSSLAWMATYVFARSLRGQELDRTTFILFAWLQVFTACGFAFSHGANDIANAIGPFAAILDVIKTGRIDDTASVPTPAMVAFGVALVVGLWFIGKEVIQTVGHNLTKMHPASGFAAELAASAVVLMASLLGIPVSSTHILIGAVLGIGLVNKQTNWGLMKPIGLAWVITLPAAALLAAAGFVALNAIF
ncbi:MAG: inorganic phosphate transporter [Pseudomonadota bacterium]